MPGGGKVLNRIPKPAPGQNRLHRTGDLLAVADVPIDRITADLPFPEGDAAGLKGAAAGDQRKHEPVLFRRILPYPVGKRCITGPGHHHLRPGKFPNQRLLAQFLRGNVRDRLGPDHRHGTLFTGQRLAIPSLKIRVLQHDLKGVNHLIFLQPVISHMQLGHRAGFVRHRSSHLLQQFSGVLSVLVPPDVDPVRKGRMAHIVVAHQRPVESKGHQDQRRAHAQPKAQHPVPAGGPLPAPLCQQANRTGRGTFPLVFGHILQLGPHGLHGGKPCRPPGGAPGGQQQRQRTPERRSRQTVCLNN